MKHHQGRQVAALPFSLDPAGRPRVLLVTTRRTRRWIVPKGWVMQGTEPWRAAAIEAMEEAGVSGEIARTAIGAFSYGKVLGNGRVLPCEVDVYPLLVRELADKWKERGQRRRQWFAPEQAARLVQEEDLARLLLRFERDLMDQSPSEAFDFVA